MKRQFPRRVPMLAVVCAFLILVLAVGVALALTLGNADGRWSGATSVGGGTPECLRYGTTSSWTTSPTAQDGSTTDENQVRWGSSSQYSCNVGTSQSGYGFNGTDGPLTFEPGAVFLLGKFIHYNNPVYFDSNNGKPASVNLAMTLGFTDPATSVTFNFTVNHDETDNNASPCPYGDSTGNGCDDRVTMPTTITDQVFNIDGVPHTLQIVGFVPGTSAACPAEPAGAPSSVYITGEQQNNYACMYGRIVLPSDSGDAPDLGLGQTTGGTRAVHTITASGPYLGATKPDGEINGQPNADATGDDLADFDDEDGFVSKDPSWNDGGSVTVSVSMGSASRACVYAWVDWANDGFGVGADSTAQGEMTSAGQLVLTFPQDANMPDFGGFPSEAYLRLRIKSGDPCPVLGTAGNGPTGSWSNGEVEDYKLLFDPNAVTLSSFAAQAPAAGALLAGLAGLVGIAGVALRRRR